jgi:hypothetical protein
VTLSNISVKYFGSSGINGERMINVSWLDNDVRWGGGDIQTYPTRYGNCLDVQMNATNVLVAGNNVSQCYDGCITIEQYLSGGEAHVSNVEVRNNLFTYCQYPVEYFSSVSTSTADKINIHHNTLAHAGEQWAWNERGDSGLNSQVRLSRTPVATTNFNFTDNIIYTTKNYAIYMGSGASTNWLGDLHMNRNLYFNTTGNVTITYNGSEPSHKYVGLAAFKAAWSYQEVNGIEDNPDFVLNTYIPNSTSPACTMGVGGSYVGAFPCAGDESPAAALAKYILGSSVIRIMGGSVLRFY